MRIVFPLALALACTPQRGSERARPAVPETAPEAQARALPPELAGVLEPWHPFDPATAEASPVWLLTRYEPGTYPCSPGPDGSFDMLVQDRFAVVQMLRGAVAAPGVDVDLHALRGPAYPRAYAEGRRYVLFLRPGPKAQAILADPDHLGASHSRLGADDVLAVIDVDENAAAIAAEAVQASRTGEAGEFRFDPARWSAAREAAALDPASQRALAEFLRAKVLVPGAPMAEVRAWLGAPDHQRRFRTGAREDQYILARPAYVAPTHGAIYGDLQVAFDARLELHSAQLTYLRWRVRPGESASVALTPAEHGALGLPTFEYRRR